MRGQDPAASSAAVANGGGGAGRRRLGRGGRALGHGSAGGGKTISGGIHPAAVIDRRAELDSSVEVGPGASIGPQVKIGAGTIIGPNTVIEGPASIGERNRIFQFAAIGAVPQDLKYRGEPSRIEIGNDNQIREFVTIHRGTEGGGMLTKIGNSVLLMTY